MKKLLYLFVATSILLASCSKDCATPEPQEEWLFVHTAVSAKILNATTIVMPVTKKIFAFTDRPYRKQYYMTGQRYADLWTHSGENSFQDDPPNAVLTWVDGEEMKDVEVVITHAVSDSNTITYTINDTSGVIAGDIVDASLFVDGNNSVLSIGDSYGGGLIFYLDGKGGGLITAPSDQAAQDPNYFGPFWVALKSGAHWGCGGYHTPGAKGTAIGTGQQNTMDIVAFCNFEDNPTAAAICANLNLGGYDDWFLPSRDELSLMYRNIGQGNALGLGNIGGFSDLEEGFSIFYWSSSQHYDSPDPYNPLGDDIYHAWGLMFSNGTLEWQNDKDYGHFVRAIRDF